MPPAEVCSPPLPWAGPSISSDAGFDVPRGLFSDCTAGEPSGCSSSTGNAGLHLSVQNRPLVLWGR